MLTPWSKPIPKAPQALTVNTEFQGLLISYSPIPEDCIGICISINGEKHFTSDDSFHYYCVMGDFTVKAAYYDCFGEGTWTKEQTVSLVTLVDPAWLKRESITLEKVDKSIQTAVKDAQDSVTGIAELKTTTDSISSTVSSNKAAQDAQNKKFVSQISQTSSQVSSVVTDLSNAKTDLSNTKAQVNSNYTAILQNQNDIALRVKTGELIQQINLSKEGVAINGSKVHITGETVFDNGVIVSSYLGDKQIVGTKIADGAITTGKLSANSVTAGKLASNSVTTDKIAAGAIKSDKLDTGAVTADKIKAGAITADKLTSGAVTADKLAANTINLAGALKIVGGNVTLDEDGMTVKETNGSSVLFGENGMSFVDSNGHTFSGIGRFCTGIVNDGQTVKFANPWDITPTVFLFPIRLQTSAVGYTNINMYQDVEAINVSANGFTAVCKSVLKAGSGSNIPVSWECRGSNENPGGNGKNESYKYNINVPTSATHIWISIEISAFYQSYVRVGKNDYHAFVAWDEGSVSVSTNTGVSEARNNCVNGYDGQSAGEDTYSHYKRDTKSFTFDMDLSHVSTVTVTFSFSGACDSRSYGKILSYRTNLNSDVTVCRGTAGFIAIDPNTVPYTIS
ncbi:hypothetical protein C6362_09530 [Megasphaera elsdenii DSM 20460]|nr:hypothetical protein C6362_09530 [Megasphaera elsdenii DSM 20460]